MSDKPTGWKNRILSQVVTIIRTRPQYSNMTIRNIEKKISIKKKLLKLLLDEHVFWSYDPDSIQYNSISDDQLIALTMRHLDLDEIKMLFDIYPKNKIKTAWRKLLVHEGQYLYILNSFFAWYYIGSKKHDSYIKSLETRHFNHLSLQ